MSFSAGAVTAQLNAKISGFTKAFKKAQGSLQDFRGVSDRTSVTLQNMQNRMQGLKTRLTIAKKQQEAFNSETSELTRIRVNEKVRKISEDIRILGNRMEQTKNDGRGMYDRLDDIGNKTQTLGSKISGLKGDLSSLKGGFDTLSVAAGNVLAEAFVSLTEKVTEFGTAVVSAAAQTEQQSIAFKTLFDSAEDAQKIMKQINKFAVATPYDVSEIRDVAKQLNSFEIAQEEIIPTTKMLGDISAGTGGDLKELGRVYGQVRAKGKLYAEEINQLGEQGIAIRKRLADDIGVSVSELMEGMSTGDIVVEFEQVKRVLGELHKSKFQGLLAEQADTLKGKWQNLTEQASLLGQKVLGINPASGKIREGSFIADAKSAISSMLGMLEGDNASKLKPLQNVMDGVIDNIQKILSVGKKVFDTLIVPIRNFIDWIRPKVKDLVEDLFGNSDAKLEKISKDLKSLWNNVLKPVDKFFVNVLFTTLKSLDDILAVVYKSIKFLWVKVLTPLWHNILVPIGNFLQNTFNKAWEKVTTVIAENREEIQKVKEKIQEFWDNIVDMKDGVVSAFQTVKDKVKVLLDDIFEDSGKGLKVLKEDLKSFWKNVLVPLWKNILVPLWKNVLKPLGKVLLGVLYIALKQLDEVVVILYKSFKFWMNNVLIPFWKNVIIPLWKTLRSLWKNVLVPLWKNVLVPLWKNVLVPLWKNVLVPLWKNVLVPLWKNVIVPLAKFMGGVLWNTLKTLWNALKSLWQKVLVPLWKNVLVPLWKNILVPIWKNVIVPVAKFIGGVLWKSIKTIWNVLKGLWNNVLVPLWRNVLVPLWKNVLVPVGNFLKNSLKNAWDKVTNVVEKGRKKFQQIKQKVQEFWDKAISMKDSVVSAFQTMKTKIKTAIDNMIAPINKAKSALSGLKSKADDAISGAKDAARQAQNAINTANSISQIDIGSAVSSAVGRASGGPVSSGQTYEVGERNKPEFYKTGDKLHMIPGNDGEVFSNADVKSMLDKKGNNINNNSTTNNINISVNNNNPKAVIKEIEKYMRSSNNGFNRNYA